VSATISISPGRSQPNAVLPRRPELEDAALLGFVKGDSAVDQDRLPTVAYDPKPITDSSWLAGAGQIQEQ